MLSPLGYFESLPRFMVQVSDQAAGWRPGNEEACLSLGCGSVGVIVLLTWDGHCCHPHFTNEERGLREVKRLATGPLVGDRQG